MKRILAFLFSVLIISSSVWAESHSLTQAHYFYDVTDLSATETTDPFVLPLNLADFAFFLKVDGAVTGTLDVVIQHSPDLVHWYTLDSFAQVSATDADELLIKSTSSDPFSANSLLRYVRLSTTLSSGPVNDVTVALFYSKAQAK